MIVVVGIAASALSAAARCVDTILINESRKPYFCTSFTQGDIDHVDNICLVVIAVVWFVYQVLEALLVVWSLRIHPQSLIDMQQQLENRLKPVGKEGAARYPSP